ncbi:MAG: Hpt domain-containing protein, partial [Candidatus Aminicenantes bacterium]|nr:Hpt domain-containing protein [Candidatus Aminicenantes bacterium]
RENNFEKIKIIGHTLKGSSAMLSLTLMHRYSAQIEKAGNDGDLVAANKLIRMMKNESLNLMKLFPISPDIVN